MNELNVRCLTTVPVSDGNFKSALVTATNEEIERAIFLMKSGTGKHKSRIAACEREIRVIERRK